jgi:N-acetylneuraminic acid mutarotase
MRKTVALLLALFFLTASCVIVAKPVSSSAEIVENSWVSKAPMHVARSKLGVAVVNGMIYAIGGFSGNEFIGTNEEYNPSSDTWSFKASMPTPRASFGIAVYQNKIYCIGGLAGVEQNPYKRILSGANEVYNPVTDEWETKASMPTIKEGVTASVVGSKIYVIGGDSSVNYVYDPATNMWDTKASMPVTPHLSSGWSCTSAVVDDKIHVIGLGINGAFHEIYDPKTDNWSSGALKGTAYASAGATTGVNAPKRMYLFSAEYANWELNPPSIINLIYDPESDSWDVGASMPTGRANAGVAVVNDELYVIGGATLEIGMSTLASAANEQYTPVGFVPEFPAWLILPLFVAVTLFAVATIKKKALRVWSRNFD